MILIARLFLTLFLAALALFCLYGFAATFEPLPRLNPVDLARNLHGNSDRLHRGNVENLAADKMTAQKKRCAWPTTDPLYLSYHDKEWGVPLHNDRKLFEFLILEGAQAGLSWITILKKRPNYRKAFNSFDFNKIATYRKPKIESLLKNEGIIRNRLKIESTVTNAKAYLAVRKEFKTFDRYLWDFVDGKPIQNRLKKMGDIPAHTPLSDKLSKDLKQRGFKFVGGTIAYAFMQAVGMVNDHTTDCFRYKELR